MIGNSIVVLVVCCAVFYLYRQWEKIKNSDSPSCPGCDACNVEEKSTQTTILDTMAGDNTTDENTDHPPKER